jgi:adenylate kinase family enzyme
LIGETAVATAKKHSSVSVTQFVALIVATIALSLLVDFGRKVALYRHLQAEEARLDQAIELEENRQDYLEWLKGYVQTEEYVGGWVRKERKWVKSGETGVVLMLPEATVTPQEPPPEESPPTNERSRWRGWWERLFD